MPPTSPYASRLIYLLKQLDAGLRPVLEDISRDHGLSVGQYTALSVLLARPGITSSELARRSFVRAQSMEGTLRPLVEQGLIQRTQDPGHARRLLLSATEKGRRTHARIQQDVSVLEQRLVEGLDAVHLAALTSALRTLRSNVSGLSTAAPALASS